MNKEEFDYLGITKWHELGIKGQGITIASREGLATKHGRCVYDILKQVCPEADIKLKCDFNKDNDYDIYTTSLFFASDKTKEKRSQQLINMNKILVCAAGNEGNETQTPLSRLEPWLSIGAIHLFDGKIEIPKYSSSFDGLDFMSFSNVSVQSKKNKIKGTSFSAPLFASMCALAQSYFLEKTEKKLTYNQMLQFIKVNCVDICEKGYDIRSGYGLFVLPEPDLIDISKYINAVKKEGEAMIIYKTLNDIPTWGKPTIEKLLNKKAIQGDENGDLNISDDLLRTLVIHDRLKLYD